MSCTEEIYDRVREAAADLGRGVGVLADLQGPKIRVGRFEEGPVRLGFGDVFTITTEDVPGDREQVSTTYKRPARRRAPAATPSWSTTAASCWRSPASTATRVTTRVVIGGMISDNKGLNLPGINVSAPALTDKDEADLRWALRIGFDMIALSFVRRPSDADVVRNIMEQEAVTPAAARQDREAAGGRPPPRDRRGVRRHHGRPR